MNTTTYHGSFKTGAKRKQTGCSWLSPLAGLMAVLTLSTSACAVESVDTVLTDPSGNNISLGEMAVRLAAKLGFQTTRQSDAIFWLQGGQVGDRPGHQPPLAPLGGWTNPARNATVGDLTVVLVQQFRVVPTSSGGTLTAQDYQNALTSTVGSNAQTYALATGIFSGWVNPTIDPVGPKPDPQNGQQTRSGGT